MNNWSSITIKQWQQNMSKSATTFFNILKGFWYWAFTPKHIKELSEKRMKICNSCDWNKKGICGLCGCVLKAKTKVPEEHCQSMKWGAEPNQKSA